MQTNQHEVAESVGYMPRTFEELKENLLLEFEIMEVNQILWLNMDENSDRR